MKLIADIKDLFAAIRNLPTIAVEHCETWQVLHETGLLGFSGGSVADDVRLLVEIAGRPLHEETDR